MWNYSIVCMNHSKRKREITDSVLWQTPLHPQTNKKKKQRDNTKTLPKNFENTTTADRPRTVIGETNVVKFSYINWMLNIQSYKLLWIRIYDKTIILLTHSQLCWASLQSNMLTENAKFVHFNPLWNKQRFWFQIECLFCRNIRSLNVLNFT